MNFKQRIRRSFFWPLLCATKAHRLDREYIRRRDRYRHYAAPEPAAIAHQLRAELSKRGWKVEIRELGHIRTFAIVSSFSWHNALVRELQPLGPVVRFDHCDLHPIPHQGKAFLEQRRSTNERLWHEICQAHEREPFDWVFAYAQGNEILAATIQRIRDKLGIPCINMCLDDKQSWGTRGLGEQWNGQRALAGVFDLYWTSARVCCQWIAAEGGLPIYMPEGCDPSQFYPQPGVPQDIDVSFVGACYGPRPQMIRALRDAGIDVKVSGPGWGRDITRAKGDELVNVFRRSKINLGLGAVLHSMNITNVKGRDFEVPCTGGGVYLTQYNSDLAEHFHIGQEIACYHNFIDMVEQVQFLLSEDARRAEMSRRARERCLREHRWAHRYLTLLKILGIVSPEAELPAFAEIKN
jgi:spore maturation protein CgeB